MRLHTLPPGTVLDERYRIESTLGEGGFGITYAARNIRLDLKVAIKELFWRNHCARDAGASLQVELTRPEDGAVFEEQKKRFLREARTIRDFSNRNNVARVLDYFEANGTAYIVMEYVEGETLGAHVAARGPLDVEDAFRRFLPLADSLSFIHKSGVIHRDISPDNIMVQPDGSLKLIDFGAAREFSAASGEKYSVIAKDSFAPPEQYDRNGNLGPWTDIYALCATLYASVTGQPPVGSMQRMFLDELRVPSQLRPDLDGKYEAVILRGMALSAAKRWQDMDELARAMRAALPEPESAARAPVWKRALICACVGMLCVAAALAAVFYRDYREAHYFGGAPTETFYLIAPERMSAKDFAAAQRDLDGALARFAGDGNYLVRVDGTQLHVELPLELFAQRDIGGVLRSELSGLLDEYDFDCTYQIQVNWDDPTASLFAGANQVRSEEFAGETAIFSYKMSGGDLTAGQRANLLMDFKTRLDALGLPYAFGTAYGNPNEIVYRIDPAPLGRCVTDTIGARYPLEIAGEAPSPSEALSFDSSAGGGLRVTDNGDGTYGLRFEVAESYVDDFREMTASLLQQGVRALYLQTSNRQPLARFALRAPVADGVVEFQEFMFDGLERIDAEHRYILDYLAALVADTCLPRSCYLSGEGIWDAKGGGRLQFDASVSDRFRLSTRCKDGDQRVRDVLARVGAETGYDCSHSNGMFWIGLHLRPDERLMENISTIVPTLLETYPISDILHDSTVAIQLMDEDDGRYRILLRVAYDLDAKAYYHEASALFSPLDPEASAPCAEAFAAWWEAFPAEKYGYRKEP